MMHIQGPRLRLLAALAIAATSLAACNNPSEPEEAEPDISSVTIEHASGTVTLSPGQTGTMSLLAGASNMVTIRVRNSAGADDPVIVADAEDYEIRMTQGTSSRFAQSGTAYPFTGIITTTPTVGTAVFRVEVYSKHHDHVEYTAFLAVAVTASGVS